MLYKVIHCDRCVSSLVTWQGNCDISRKKYSQMHAIACLILHVYRYNIVEASRRQCRFGQLYIIQILLLWATAITMCCQCIFACACVCVWVSEWGTQTLNEPYSGFVLGFKQQKAGRGKARLHGCYAKSPTACTGQTSDLISCARPVIGRSKQQ